MFKSPLLTALSAALLLLAPVGCGDDGGAGGGVGGGGAHEGDGGTGGGSAEEPAALAGITAAHNAVRANASPSPEPALSPLSWSPTLAGVAAGHAARCVFEHSSNGYGENIYASAGGTPGPTAALDSWASEVADYNYANNSCSDVCGHYTQVVWRGSSELGCALQECDRNSPFGSDFPTWYLVVCNYDPPGNYIGEKPY